MTAALLAFLLLQPIVRERQFNWRLDEAGRPLEHTLRTKTYERREVAGRMYRVLVECDGRAVPEPELIWIEEAAPSRVESTPLDATVSRRFDSFTGALRQKVTTLTAPRGGLQAGTRMEARYEHGVLRSMETTFLVRSPDGALLRGLQRTEYERDTIGESRCASPSCSSMLSPSFSPLAPAAP
jgi:hypothetical protein